MKNLLSVIKNGILKGINEHSVNILADIIDTPDENDNIAVKNINSKINAASTFSKRWVNLDLPSGTLWATCNVGASKEYEIGDFISWGELKPKREYTLSTYKFINNSNDDITKYNGDDNLTELELIDDIAYYKDKNACLPSPEQFAELNRYTMQSWVDDYNNSGISGMLFTGMNNNSIFFPAAGYKKGVEHRNYNKSGWYFTNSLYYLRSARFLQLDDMSSSIYCNGNRYIGMSIRPVLNNK